VGLYQYSLRVGQGYAANESRGALGIGRILEGVQEFGVVGLVDHAPIRTWSHGVAAVSSAAYSRGSSQRVHFEPRVVGQTPSPGGLGVVEGLLAGVLGEGVSRFLWFGDVA